MSRYRKPSIEQGFGYEPGEQAPDGSWAKLNSNESPIDPSPLAIKALVDYSGQLRRYPNPLGEPLRSAVAEYHEVEPSQVVIGAGADQILGWCFRAFADPADVVLLTKPTYAYLPMLAKLASVRVVTTEMSRSGFAPPEFGTRPGRLRFIVNPNALTGTWLPPEEIETILRPAEGVVVVDEAYADFALNSCISVLRRHPNWLVVRTFPKSYPLAGLRVGYAIGDPDLIEDLVAVKDPSPVGQLGISAATAALQDEAHHRGIVDLVRRERRRVTEGLRKLGWEVGDSHANFILGHPPSGVSQDMVAQLRRSRVLVRRFPPSLSEDWIRITIGSNRENDQLLASAGLPVGREPRYLPILE